MSLSAPPKEGVCSLAISSIGLQDGAILGTMECALAHKVLVGKAAHCAMAVAPIPTYACLNGGEG